MKLYEYLKEEFEDCGYSFNDVSFVVGPKENSPEVSIFRVCPIEELVSYGLVIKSSMENFLNRVVSSRVSENRMPKFIRFYLNDENYLYVVDDRGKLRLRIMNVKSISQIEEGVIDF